jgi:hypothetical protein
VWRNGYENGFSSSPVWVVFLAAPGVDVTGVIGVGGRSLSSKNNPGATVGAGCMTLQHSAQLKTAELGPRIAQIRRIKAEEFSIISAIWIIRGSLGEGPWRAGIL